MLNSLNLDQDILSVLIWVQTVLITKVVASKERVKIKILSLLVLSNNILRKTILSDNMREKQVFVFLTILSLLNCFSKHCHLKLFLKILSL